MSSWATTAAESILGGAAHNRSTVAVMVGIDLHIKAPAVAAEYMRLAEAHMPNQTLADYRDLRDIIHGVIDALKELEE